MRTGRSYYVGPGEKRARNFCCQFVLIVICIVLLIGVWEVEKEWRERNFAYDEVRPLIKDINGEKFDSYFSGNVVHFSSNNIKTPENLKDIEFNLPAPPNALKFIRDTEYCQYVVSFQFHVDNLFKMARNCNLCQR
jgi:hypothetical protein